MESFYSEIRAFVAQKVAANVIVRVDWMTAEYIKTKARADGEDMPFYRACAGAHVADLMRRVVGKYESRPQQTDSQIVLPGFEHLQRAYTVVRDGVNVLVPVQLLTNAELEARANEYDAMARGCRAHAREIRSFVAGRKTLEEAV